MLEAAEKLEFERAAALRDRIQQIRSASSGGPSRPAASPQAQSARKKAKAKADDDAVSRAVRRQAG